MPQIFTNPAFAPELEIVTTGATVFATLQQLLGHRKIDTTLQYAMVKQSNVKLAHRRYIG